MKLKDLRGFHGWNEIKYICMYIDIDKDICTEM